eukprot:4119525-Alexandrium_andersonii.AAC.1
MEWCGKAVEQDDHDTWQQLDAAPWPAEPPAQPPQAGSQQRGKWRVGAFKSGKWQKKAPNRPNLRQRLACKGIQFLPKEERPTGPREGEEGGKPKDE